MQTCQNDNAARSGAALVNLNPLDGGRKGRWYSVRKDRVLKTKAVPEKGGSLGRSGLRRFWLADTGMRR
jgi:hypothetical protein